MATGTTANATYRRDEIIAEALVKVGAATTNGSYSLPEVDRAIKSLNRILRREDLRGVGSNTHLWAMSDSALILQASVQLYGSSEGLATDILDIHSINYRDKSGNDYPIDLITAGGYGAIADKIDSGEPTQAYLKRHAALASQKLYINRAPSSITTADVVTGTDALNYTCILKHTAATTNRPITGADYTLYWRQTGTGGSAWAADTEYANSEGIFYVYKRPLWDFDLATDNPDMPLGWEDYLIFSLALALAPNYKVPLQDRAWIEDQMKKARKELFPSSRSDSTDIYNRGCFY